MTRSSAATLLAALALLGAACGAPPTPPGVGDTIPEFELTSLGGEPFSDPLLTGRPAVISFWATWCQPCLRDIPEFNALVVEDEMQVVAIALDAGGRRVVAPFVEAQGLRARVLIGDEAVFRRFGGSTVPHTLVVDSSRTVRAIFRGPVTRSEVLASLE